MAASNRDGRVMHDNDGTVVWGGTRERWDLLQLVKNGPLNGGEQLRRRVRDLMKGASSEPVFAAPADQQSRLAFNDHHDSGPRRSSGRGDRQRSPLLGAGG